MPARVLLRHHALHESIRDEALPQRVLQCISDSIVPQRKEALQYLRHCIPSIVFDGKEIPMGARYYITFRQSTFSYVLISLENKTRSTVLVLELPPDLTRLVRTYIDSIDTIMFPATNGSFMNDSSFSKFCSGPKGWNPNRARHAMSNHLMETNAPSKVKQAIATGMSTSIRTLHGDGDGLRVRRVSPNDGVGAYFTSFTPTREANIATAYMKYLLAKPYVGFFCVVKVRGERMVGKVVSVSDQGVASFVIYELGISEKNVVVLGAPDETSKCMALVDVNKVTAIECVLRGLHAPTYSDEHGWHWTSLGIDQVRALLPSTKVTLSRGLLFPSKMEIFPGQIIKVHDSIAEVRGAEKINDTTIIIHMPLTLVGDKEWTVEQGSSVARACRSKVSLLVEWFYTDFGYIKVR